MSTNDRASAWRQIRPVVRLTGAAKRKALETYGTREKIEQAAAVLIKTRLIKPLSDAAEKEDREKAASTKAQREADAAERKAKREAADAEHRAEVEERKAERKAAKVEKLEAELAELKGGT